VIELSQRQIAPYGRELRIDLGRTLPAGDSHVILAFVIVETPQVIGCTGIWHCQREYGLERKGIFQTIGETVGRIGLTGSLEIV
jgi:hypothetical protein